MPPSGSTITILRVTEEAEEDARLLTFLQENGVRPGHVFDAHRRGRAHRHDDPAAGQWGRQMDGHKGTIGLVRRREAAGAGMDVPTRRCSTMFQSELGWPTAG